MSRAAKIKARSDLGHDPRMGRAEPLAGSEVNDNTPVAFPGHELSDLNGVSHEPAAEVVVHYTRFSQITSFPLHPHAAATVVREPPAMDALPEPVRRRKPAGKKRTTITCISSFLFHAALFAALTTASVTLPEDPVEEAGDTVSVVMLGDSDADQLTVGDKQKDSDPVPEQVVSEAVQPDVVQPTTGTAEVTPVETPPTPVAPTEVPPTDAQPVEPVQPTTTVPQPDPVQPTQQVQEVSPETIVSPEPEVLASEVPAEPTVVQPMATAVQPEEIRPAEAETAEVQPAEVQPPAVQPVKTEPVAPEPPPPEVVTPIEKPLPPKPQPPKPKGVVKKQPPKPVKPKSGSEGENQQNRTRGSAEGTETAQSDHSSESAGNRQGSGSAAVANYPGKVQSRIRRSVRVPEEFKRMTAETTVRVRLTIGSGGELTSLSLSRSSGVSELDNAVLEGVRRAAPFPSLPPEWGKPSWSFTQEVQVTGN